VSAGEISSAFRPIADIAGALICGEHRLRLGADLQWKSTVRAIAIAPLTFVSTPAPAANPPSAMMGKWVSECLPLGKSGRHGLIITLDVSTNSFRASGQMYGRNICDAPVIAFDDRAIIERAEAKLAWWDLRLKLVGATMTINDKSVANLYAEDKKCGLASWQVDLPMHVDGRKCEPVSYPSKGAVLVAKARISTDRLVLQDLSALFGAKPEEGIVLPQDVEFRRK
jgi:hypothetical protein